MDNNKNLVKTDEKSNAELRKMFPQNGGDIGIIDGEKIGAHANGKKFTRRSKLSHNK
jgi:hypothetical protein